jgi:TatD DNase family protein
LAWLSINDGKRNFPTAGMTGGRLIMAIDTHCHLTLRFEPYEVAGVLDRAAKAGVDGVILVGYCPVHYKATTELLNQFGTGGGNLPALAGTAGIHPHEAGKYNQAHVEAYREALQRFDIIAIGETGLDFFRDYSPRDLQVELFRAQVRLSSETGYPLIIHSRSAFEETIQVLGEFTLPRSPGVFHCYGYGPSEVDKVTEMGFFLSFAGNLTYPAAEELREAAKIAPIDRILVETDSPFLIPQKAKNKKVRRCEPAHVIETRDRLAEIRGLPAEKIDSMLKENALNCFPKLRAIDSWAPANPEVDA